MNNEVMVSDKPVNLPAVSEETRFMMDMISQIALNPDADVEKLRAVMDMKMQMFNRGAEIEFNAAMALAQAEIEPVARTASNQQTKSKYAKLENIITTCSPVWTSHGFALSYDTGDCPLERHYRVTCEVSHRAGHSKHYHMDLPIDDAGINGTKNKTGVHGAGSTISYGKRYIACNIFNIAIKDEDNDGNGNNQQPVGAQCINNIQLKTLRDAMRVAGVTDEQFCNHKKIAISRVEELPQARLAGAISLLKKFAGIKQ